MIITNSMNGDENIIKRKKHNGIFKLFQAHFQSFILIVIGSKRIEDERDCFTNLHAN